MKKRHAQTVKTVFFLLAATAGIVLSAGCSSTRTVFKNVNATARQVTGTSTTNGKATLQAANAAFNYCYARDKRIVMTDVITNYQAIGMPKRFIYSTTIYFHCAAPWYNA